MECPSRSSSPSLHIAMYPWLAIGHITPFFQLANKLAQRNYKVSFLTPPKTQSKIQHLNKVPHLITFVPVAVPHVDGLPPGAETTADVEPALFPLIATAMDKTEHDVEILLQSLKPDIVFFDFAYWLPKLSRSMGFKTVYLSVVSPLLVAYMTDRPPTEPPEKWLSHPPAGFPDLSIKLNRHEIPHFVQMGSRTFGSNIKLPARLGTSVKESDAYAMKGITEIDGPFVNFIERKLNRKIWLTGPILPEPSAAGGLEPGWDRFLSRFERSSVVYCCLGSEHRMSVAQFRELVLGLELCGRPFLVAVTPPEGAGSVEEALPEGFSERVGERGAVHGGWIQQQKILAHPSVGCFLTHCGAGSLTEALVHPCQLVMIPYHVDNFFLARMIGNSLKAGIEVERDEESGWYCKESVSKAIHAVMCEEQSNEIGEEIRANRAKLQKLMQNEDLEACYMADLSCMLTSLAIH